MRALARTLLFALCFVLVAPEPSVAEEAEVQELRKELERMVKLIEVQSKALLNLEKRMRELEAAGAQPPAVPSPAPEPPPVAVEEAPEAPREMVEPSERPAQELPVPDGEERAVTEQDVDIEETVPPTAETEEVKKEAGPSRSLEAAQQEATGFFGKRYTIENAITYSHTDRSEVALSGFLALDAIFLGTIAIDEIESDIVTSEWTGRVGITERLQAEASAPFVFRHSNFISGGAGGAATSLDEKSVTSSNLGDVSAGVHYRVLSEAEYIPDVSVRARVRAPTGTSPFGIELREVEGSQGNLMVPEELPTGNGVWQGSIGVSALKTYDPAILFVNLDYFHNLERSLDDISSAPGDQPGEVDVGDSFEIGFGAAYALNERLSLSLSYTQRFFEKTRTKLDGGEFEDVIGSDANVARLNLGATLAITDNLTLVTNVSAGLTEDASDVEFSIRLPYSF